MSVHINKEDDAATLQFESSSYENVFIQTEWTIVAGGSGDAIAKSQSIAEGIKIAEGGEFTTE